MSPQTHTDVCVLSVSAVFMKANANKNKYSYIVANRSQSRELVVYLLMPLGCLRAIFRHNSTACDCIHTNSPRAVHF